MTLTAAAERQVQAADPLLSTWLSANAGSGKTRVLIDRVARLLMGGCEPQRILCLTYTTAAASEMQNRLFRRLGEWAMLPEADLTAALSDLGVEGSIDTDALLRARRLFARAIETPGGLKIQTIHSFCSGLLRRFPLEAGVSPNFTELDDRSAHLLREDIFEEMAAGGDVAALDAVAGLIPGEDLAAFLANLCRNRAGFDPPLDRDGVFALFDLPAGLTYDQLLRAVLEPGDIEALKALAPLLLGSGATDSKAGAALAAALAGEPGPALLSKLESILLHGPKAEKAGPYSPKIGAFPTKALREKGAAPLMPVIEALMERVAAARDRRIALDAAERTAALHRFAGAFLPRYAARKAEAGLLDFDDLIALSARLLSDVSVAWVLFRLDGGIDHVLVDEAQDTSPGQWQVIERLTEEFTAGEGARGPQRTVFVVGDKKQSIYSFQGADLRAFDAMNMQFRDRFAQIGQSLQSLDLEYSFRSSEAILRVVDLTFDERVQRGLGGPLKHIAFHSGLPGRVDLWPFVPRSETPEPEDWFNPVDILPDAHHDIVLARRVAAEIRAMIDAGTTIPTARGLSRPVDEGDFLILVQRRSPLFHEIIRACKAEHLEIAGADRLKIGGELAVKDLTALLRFLATPEDDLSLAAVLRSPLFGWSENDLYHLAHDRPPNSFLWQALRSLTARHDDTLAVLDDLRMQADYLRPHDLIERMLTRHRGRERLVARLGPEAEDGIDALLDQALGFERTEVPGLLAFLSWMDTDEVVIKRRVDSASRAIRVMTVHGAKGLEAPIVILPDSARRQERVKDEIYHVGGRAVWRTNAEESPPVIAAQRADLLERQREERMRLLYVAMTRAEVWLIVCGAGDPGTDTESWYGLVRDGVEKAGGVTLETRHGPGLRHELGPWPAAAEIRPALGRGRVKLPEWAARDAPPAIAPARVISPSALEGAKALPGEDMIDQDAAMARGSALHLLLEHLPLWPQEDWPAIATSLVGDGFDADDTRALLSEARGVLGSGGMAVPDGATVLTEVELTAPLAVFGGQVAHGTIDRLVITADSVLAIDYKSNATVPSRAEEVPAGILRQMGAYAGMLAAIYPDRRIDTAILWTRTGQFMPLPPDIVREALASTPIP